MLHLSSKGNLSAPQSYREQLRAARELPDGLPEAEAATPEERAAAEEMRRSDEIFAADHVSMGWCGAGYVASCALAIGVVPILYPPAKWCAHCDQAWTDHICFVLSP